MVYWVYCSLLINWNGILRYAVKKAELQIDKVNPWIDHTFTGLTLPAKQRNDQDQGLSLGIAAKISWERLLLLIASWDFANHLLTIQRYHLYKETTDMQQHQHKNRWRLEVCRSSKFHQEALELLIIARRQCLGLLESIRLTLLPSDFWPACAGNK